MYDINNQGIYLSVYSNFENIAYIDLANFDMLNYGNFSLENSLWQDTDGNEELEPGDTINIFTTISSEFNAYGVVGNLSTEHAFIQILDGNTTFGDINHDSLAIQLDDPFKIALSSDASNQQAELQLTLTTNYGYQFILPLSFTINGVFAENVPVQPQIVESLRNYPNPFNPETMIEFSLPKAENVSLTIYNNKGQKVKTLVSENCEAGAHSVVWNGKNYHNENVASGLYFYELKLNGQVQAVKKMILMK